MCISCIKKEKKEKKERNEGDSLLVFIKQIEKHVGKDLNRKIVPRTKANR